MSADTGDGGEHSYPINCRLRLRDTALCASITLKNASLGRRHCLRRWERVLFEHQPTLFIITLYSLPFSVELNFRQLTISLHHPLEAPCLTVAPVTVLRMQHHRQHTSRFISSCRTVNLNHPWRMVTPIEATNDLVLWHRPNRRSHGAQRGLTMCPGTQLEVFAQDGNDRGRTRAHGTGSSPMPDCSAI